MFPSPIRPATSSHRPSSHPAMEPLRSLALPAVRLLALVLLAFLLILVLLPAALAAQAAVTV
ncbi:MAG TPA: hypothetical protein VF763_10895 [Candidatus Limnocylindrales bacterium]